MSMIGNLSRIPEDIRVALHKDPETINAVLYPDFIEEAPAKKPSLFSFLFGKQQVSKKPKEESIYTLSEEDSIDVDKAWHALHFLFTDSDWEGDFPQGFLVSCGEPVGDVDVGYGPAKSFNPDQVGKIAEYLTSLDRSKLRGRLDPEKMHKMEIYPSIWKDCENSDDEWEYIEGGLEEIIRFMSETVQKNMALLVYIN